VGTKSFYKEIETNIDHVYKSQSYSDYKKILFSFHEDELMTLTFDMYIHFYAADTEFNRPNNLHYFYVSTIRKHLDDVLRNIYTGSVYKIKEQLPFILSLVELTEVMGSEDDKKMKLLKNKYPDIFK
jgi:hypothetical protein